MAAATVGSAAVALHLGLGLSVAGSAPRGMFRAVAQAPARGALVVACLPTAVAAFARARGYLGAGNCPGRTQPVLKNVGAVAADVVDLATDASVPPGHGHPGLGQSLVARMEERLGAGPTHALTS